MKHVFIATFAAAALWAGALAAETPPAGGVAVTDAWARASPGMATTGAAFFTLANSGAPDSLTGVSTPVAGKAEVYEMANDKGVMQMRPVAGLPLEPGKPVTLAPGGYHIMLMQLTHPLKPGETFPLTLSFAHAQPVTVEVKVGALGAGGKGMSGMQNHMDGMQEHMKGMQEHMNGMQDHMDNMSMPGTQKP